jgi:FkbM family methyltransferase
MSRLKESLKNNYVIFLKCVLDVFTFFLGKQRQVQLKSLLLERIPLVMEIPIKKGGSHPRFIKMFCNSVDSYHRATTFYTKEPGTIEWIDGFDANSLVWDIGANVGCYSLYSASVGHRVLAFEPAAANYWLLNKNIQINQLSERIQAFCLAFGENSSHGLLNLGDVNFGGACSRFSKNPLDQFDYPGIGITGVNFRQGVMSFSIDSLIEDFKFEIPQFIKIDVDGLEHSIIKGAARTFSKKKVKKVLVELEENEQRQLKETIDIFLKSGFVIESKVPASLEEDFGIFNYVFSRK